MSGCRFVGVYCKDPTVIMIESENMISLFQLTDGYEWADDITQDAISQIVEELCTFEATDDLPASHFLEKKWGWLCREINVASRNSNRSHDVYVCDLADEFLSGVK